MKVKINSGSVSLEDLKSKLSAKFPEYKFKDFNKLMFIAQKSSTVGANVVLKKDKIVIAGNFPTMGGRLLFALCLVLLGILIPLVIYLIVYHSKFTKFEKELGAYIQQEYGIKQ